MFEGPAERAKAACRCRKKVDAGVVDSVTERDDCRHVAFDREVPGEEEGIAIERTVGKADEGGKRPRDPRIDGSSRQAPYGDDARRFRGSIKDDRERHVRWDDAEPFAGVFAESLEDAGMLSDDSA